MFFSTNSSSKNGHDPFSFPPDHSFHLPISFFPFPSPFEVDDQFDEYDFMFQQPHNNFTTSNSQNNAPITTPTLDKFPTNTNTNTNMDIINSDQKKKIPRKRLSKKDRHSKITTARGLRDRRMRLSLPVARQFFGLQDMLGVDKGSKTVEWLLIQARPEILKLAKERNCSSLIMSSFKRSTNFCSHSNSEGDMVSGIDEVGVGGAENGENFVNKIKSLKSDGKKKKRVKQPRKTMAKEMREMARARARARTMEKKNQIRDCSVSDFDNNHGHHHQNYNYLNKISSCSWSSPLETGEESGGTHSYNLNLAIEVEKPITSQFGSSSQPIIDYQLQNFSAFEIMAEWSPSDSTFNYLHQTENVDLQEQNEFEDSEIFG